MTVKKGDKVILYTFFGKSVEVVEKITPKGYIRVNGMLFNADGTQRTSDVWQRNSITEYSQELADEISKESTIRKALKLAHDVSILSYEQAVEIIKILKG